MYEASYWTGRRWRKRRCWTMTQADRFTRGRKVVQCAVLYILSYEDIMADLEAHVA